MQLKTSFFHCQVGASSPNSAMPSWGFESQLGNADAGTHRPQVRMRRPKSEDALSSVR